MTDKEKQRAAEGALLGFIVMGGLYLIDPKLIGGKRAAMLVGGAALGGAFAGYLVEKTSTDLGKLFSGKPQLGA